MVAQRLREAVVVVGVVRLPHVPARSAAPALALEPSDAAGRDHVVARVIAAQATFLPTAELIASASQRVNAPFVPEPCQAS